MGRARRLTTVLALSAAGLLVLCAAAVVALDLGWQRERVRELLEGTLAGQLEAEATIGSLEGAFHSEVVARNLTVSVEGERVAALDAVRIRVGSLRLWPSARLVVEAIEIDGAHLELQRSLSGSWNLPRREAATPAESGPLALLASVAGVRIRTLELRRGIFEVGVAAPPEGRRLAGDFSLEVREIALPLKALPDASFELNLTPSEIGGARLEVGRVRGGLSAGSWAIEEAELGGEGFDLRATGRGSLSGIERLEMEGQVDEVQRFAGLLPAIQATGRLEAQAEIRGDFGRPEGNLRVAGERLALRGIPLGALDLRVRGARDGLLHLDALSFTGGRMPVAAAPGARLRLRPGGVVFEELRLAAGGQSLAIGGGLDSEGFDDLVLDGTAVDLGTLGALAGAPVELGGLADAHLEPRGRFDAPSVTGRIEWRSPRLGTTRLDGMSLKLAATPGELRIEADLRDSGRSLLVADLRVPEAPLELSVWELAASPLVEVDLRAAQLDLSLLDPLRSFGFPELRGTESFEALPGARVRLGDGEIRFDAFELLARDQRIQLTGGIGLQRFDGLRIEAQDLDVGVLADLAGTAFEVTGRLDTNLELRGPLAEPAVNGTVRWSEAGVAGVPVDRLDLDLQTIDGRIRATGTVHRGGRPVAQGNAALPPKPWSGEVPLLASSELDAELRVSQLELALLEPWLPTAFREPRGTVEGRLSLRGGRPRPRLTGSLDLRNGSLSVPLLGRTLAPISGTLRLDSDSLQIETLQVGPAGNDAVLSGMLGIDEAGLGRADLRLALRDFPLAQSGFAQASTSGSIEVSGPLDGLRVGGELTLRDVLVRLPEPRDPALKEIRILADRAGPGSLQEGPGPMAGFADQADIDLGLTVPEGSRIRGRGADFEVTGELRLRKPRLQSAGYEGSLRVQRGFYRLHGRRFELRRGVASFDGRSDPDPLLDIEAAHTAKDVIVVALITGRASNPTVRLRSEPQLPEKDVLAYLLFGRAADRVASSQQAALQAAAAGLAAGLALTEIETVLGRDLPVDSVDVRVEEDGSLGEVGVGSRLTERLSVRYGRTLGVDPEDRVGVEIQLTPRWSLESDVTSSGKAGADLIWSFDY